MVDISPFRGLVYNKEKTGDISKLVSPPYDVVSPKKREDLISFSPENIINLILPQGDGDTKYQNASKILDEWINKQILIKDECNCYYILRISFKTAQGEKSLSGFIGLTRIEDYDSGGVLRHEKTLSAPKEDRFKLLESCKTNFGLIYTIYKRSSAVKNILDNNQKLEPYTSFTPCYDSSLSFDLWKISDKDDIEKLTDAMKERQVLIADGHHRYETSLMFRNKFSNSSVPVPEDHVLMLFIDSGQEELRIYPTHRNLSFKKDTDMEKIKEHLSNLYDIKPATVKDSDSITSILENLNNNRETGFLFHSRQGSYKLVLKNSHSYDKLESPDVFILHEELLDDLDSIFGLKEISFNHDAGQIIHDVMEKKYDLGIFLNPPTVRDMEKICYSGGLMPQKSTYFWPKPCTGLVMYKF
jgi:uncharacterized protein (DUF1015 family)